MAAYVMIWYVFFSFIIYNICFLIYAVCLLKIYELSFLAHVIS